jgi:MoxR-like ATPase
MKRLLQAEPQGIDGPEEALQRGLTNDAEQLIDFLDRQDGGKFRLARHAQFLQGRPFAHASVRVEELDARISHSQRVAFPLLVVLDEE